MEILKIREHAELADKAAEWFHSKWNIPLEAYRESISECLNGESAVPQWYTAVVDCEIAGGLGVIENDFHERKDLTPNVCAVYVEKEYRCKGIAGELLNYACEDMKSLGIDTLYLVTGHTSFYERYGWEFLCPVHCDGENEPSRMYILRPRG
ncbi:MAG: GNAT family N-acetyltransferase [Clostridiales bacterium]|nr:GNAT family N-acetyltransferase [Clostridiales bacterium]